ncbi:hypothetical protein BDK51DRAFT_51624 [Blyttiomyces helicus]|uniref:Uncharacterized protein n=1 Tax=Blyttiomyces helicus TaxID=388810 RepID=A0A4V1IS54_9FUNG|nr:hypothetical protein BDK51DRAFT_51624 [Blyttiomyces helicus]|eukprot:RKO92367.1 hypothetical protein BDK51DRAFT_51624 [Blyttiomyces helicus]
MQKDADTDGDLFHYHLRQPPLRMRRVALPNLLLYLGSKAGRKRFPKYVIQRPPSSLRKGSDEHSTGDGGDQVHDGWAPAGRARRRVALAEVGGAEARVVQAVLHAPSVGSARVDGDAAGGKGLCGRGRGKVNAVCELGQGDGLVYVVVEGGHEAVGLDVGVEESLLVVGEAERGDRGVCSEGLVLRYEAVEGKEAVPGEHLAEDIVVKEARGEVERCELLARQMRVVGRVHTAESLNGSDGGEVHRVGHENVGVAVLEELVGHFCKSEALVTDAIELVADAAVETEGTIVQEPGSWFIEGRAGEGEGRTGVVEGDPEPDGRQHAPGLRVLGGVTGAALRSDEASDLVCECLVDGIGKAGVGRCLRSREGSHRKKGNSSAQDTGEHGEAVNRKEKMTWGVGRTFKSCSLVDRLLEAHARSKGIASVKKKKVVVKVGHDASLHDAVYRSIRCTSADGAKHLCAQGSSISQQVPSIARRSQAAVQKKMAVPVESQEGTAGDFLGNEQHVTTLKTRGLKQTTQNAVGGLEEKVSSLKGAGQGLETFPSSAAPSSFWPSATETGLKETREVGVVERFGLECPEYFVITFSLPEKGGRTLEPKDEWILMPDPDFEASYCTNRTPEWLKKHLQSREIPDLETECLKLPGVAQPKNSLVHTEVAGETESVTMSYPVANCPKRLTLFEQPTSTKPF